MSRFLVAARSRSEMDLPRYLGKYEFPAVPQSLFSMEGEILRQRQAQSSCRNFKVFAT